MRIFTLLLAIWMLQGIYSVAIAQPHHKQVRWFKMIHRSHPKISKRFSYQSISGTLELTQELNRIINTNGAEANVAVYVKSMKFGDSLYSRNIKKLLIPASTLKVLTAEAALLYLGANYRFSTQLLTNAKSIKKGVLQGDLYIVLSGDPSLTYDDVVELMLTLKTLQIFAISGNVYIDNTAYDQRFYGPGWDGKDKKNCYAAPISASIINHNCLAFKPTPHKILSKNSHLKIKIKPIRSAKVDRACTLRMLTLHGSVTMTHDCKVNRQPMLGFSTVVTDIPEYNRSLFKNLLTKMNMNVYGEVTFGSVPPDLSMLGSHASQPLTQLISIMLKKSDNVIAGAIFKKLGQMYTHQPGSWENGSIAVSKILAERAGVDTAGLRILDGSGLSPDNLATSAQMMQVLDFAYHQNGMQAELISALPIAGVDGTLKHRLGNIARKVRAKTGTISGVVSLAGYAVSVDKEALAFVIIVNGDKTQHWQYKLLEDEIAIALTRYTRNEVIQKAPLNTMLKKQVTHLHSIKRQKWRASFRPIRLAQRKKRHRAIKLSNVKSNDAYKQHKTRAI